MHIIFIILLIVVCLGPGAVLRAIAGLITLIGLLIGILFLANWLSSVSPTPADL